MIKKLLKIHRFFTNKVVIRNTHFSGSRNEIKGEKLPSEKGSISKNICSILSKFYVDFETFK